MHRIDAPGFAPGNLFTEGNPSLSILATEVSDDWLNDVQEELSVFIESRGITLVKGLQTQLRDAILDAIGGGGSQIKLDPLLNNTADQVIGLTLDKLVHKAAIIFVDVHRETDSSNVQETSLWLATHDSKDDAWRISAIITAFYDAESEPNITSTGIVRVSTLTLAGANYAAQLRVTGVMRFTL